MNIWEKENIKVLKQQAGIPEEKKSISKKRKRKGGPNPLSCLKKKKKSEKTVLTKSNRKVDKVRKRKKIKIAAHVKEALLTELKSESQSYMNKLRNVKN